MAALVQGKRGLYAPEADKSSCGVGFITRKDSVQTHDVIEKTHEALCVIPHRGGMSSQGVGDGAGVCLDLSCSFFRKITGDASLELGDFGVGNFFMPDDLSMHDQAEEFIEKTLKKHEFRILCLRDTPVDQKAIRPAARGHQFLIRQWVFARPAHITAEDRAGFDAAIYQALQDIEAVAFTHKPYKGLYPLSLSARTQVYKGRLNSHEVIPYFLDLKDPTQKVHTVFFHTRFSTNTAPHPIMAQPFRQMAHNGELNTDKKNRLNEDAIARMKGQRIHAPEGQSDSARLDQTLGRRLVEDRLGIVEAVVAMMPPAWENDSRLTGSVRDMLEYFSLYEEKNDGPAALIFGDGVVVGARLDRLGLRPLRTIETHDYLCVTSEAGQITFPPEMVLHRGRIEAGGMIYFDHTEKRAYTSLEALERLADARDYANLLTNSRVNLDDLPVADGGNETLFTSDESFTLTQRYVACSLNQESFKFLMDPMIQNAAEKISAMGYGAAINALTDQEGGVAKYFSQRFAQVTNPPLDSIREADGMTLRVALGAKPSFNTQTTKQIVIKTPILCQKEMNKICAQTDVPHTAIDACYSPIYDDAHANGTAIITALTAICDQVEAFAQERGGIIILSDKTMAANRAPLPGLLVVAAANQRLIKCGLRFNASLIYETGQVASSHHIAVALGFGASAISPLSVYWRAAQKFPTDPEAGVERFIQAANKSLMKTMGKIGLCTAESYIGGEFFEPSFLNTDHPVLEKIFPNMVTPVGGVGFDTIASSSAAWHQRAVAISAEQDIPLLGLFKERAQGAGHSYGTTAVRGFVDMTEEPISIGTTDRHTPEKNAREMPDDNVRLLTLQALHDAFGKESQDSYYTDFDNLSAEKIDTFQPTKRYEEFDRLMTNERTARPVALRDVLDFPADIRFAHKETDFLTQLQKHALDGNENFLVRGLDVRNAGENTFKLRLTGTRRTEHTRLMALRNALMTRFDNHLATCEVQQDCVVLEATGQALYYMTRLRSAPRPVALCDVQPASEITRTFSSGAMSHGALVAPAHEAVAHGTNMAGGLSNSGEGGEHFSRYNTIRASRIKQLASGRFGVWAGYLADPMLEELEIKIAQGAKPGEGGQLPAIKVNVEIAAARGGTPGVELISPPPHHDTYSIEDLAQLIHDAKAARVRVIVKLVSSEGIGTIAVGVAKAGADVINVAGNTGGTGAAAVTSLKNTGRAAEIGLAEVHQALCVNGIRQKVILRCSGAHQTASDVIKSALLGGDSFEFGTTALMMLKCVMAKNCNVKCPAGLTTNAEVFDGDPRALAQYLINLAHGVRMILANLGLKSLSEARGRSDLLHLLDHPSAVGTLDLRNMLHQVEETVVDHPVYLEADFNLDDVLIKAVRQQLLDDKASNVVLEGQTDAVSHTLTNRCKTVGGQVSIDIERILQYELSDAEAAQIPTVRTNDQGRRYFDTKSITIKTTGAAGQSYGAFCNNGMLMHHQGTCNDGVGKGQCGGIIAIISPGGGAPDSGGNVLIGNFALFGATGGRTYIEGEAGDRFAVRNSGAVAVVEGVGDFACEYMINGAVVNLGKFGKGFCNGMSGGFAYQYDRDGDIASHYSRDSVILQCLSNDTTEIDIHAQAVQQMLTQHVSFTGSKRAGAILENWEQERSNFWVATPRALASYQQVEDILAVAPRKALVDELATALCQYQVRKFKLAYRDGQTVLAGLTPADTANPEHVFELLNNYTVHHMARNLARKRLKDTAVNAEEKIHQAMRKLILTEDFGLMQQLMQYARQALATYSDTDIAVLISNKRLQDYKSALAKRNVLSMHSWATYAWIMLQDQKNREKMQDIPGFEALFAKEATLGIARQAS